MPKYENSYGAKRPLHDSRCKRIDGRRLHKSVDLPVVSDEIFIMAKVAWPCRSEKHYHQSAASSANPARGLDV